MPFVEPILVTILDNDFYTARCNTDDPYYSKIYNITTNSFECRYLSLSNRDSNWNYITTWVLGTLPLSGNKNFQFFLTKDDNSGTSSYYNILYSCDKIDIGCGSPDDMCNRYCFAGRVPSNFSRAEAIRYNSNNQDIFYVFDDSGGIYQFVEPEVKDFDIDVTVSSLYLDLDKNNIITLEIIGNNANDYSDDDVKWYIEKIQEINGDIPNTSSEVFIGNGKVKDIQFLDTGIYNITMKLSTTFGVVVRTKTVVVSDESANREKEESENKLLKDISLDTSYNVYNQTDLIKIKVDGISNNDNCSIKYLIEDSQNHSYIFNTTSNTIYFDTNQNYLSAGIVTIKVIVSCNEHTYTITKQIIVKEFSEVYIIPNDIILYTDLLLESVNSNPMPFSMSNRFDIYTYFDSPSIKITNKYTNNIQNDFVFAYLDIDKAWGLSPATFNFEAVLNKECEHCLFEWLNGTDIFGYDKNATLTIEDEGVYTVTLKLITPDYTLKYTTQLFVFDNIGMWYADLINKEVYYMVMQHKDIHIEDYEDKTLLGKFKKTLNKITGLSVQKLKRRIK